MPSFQDVYPWARPPIAVAPLETRGVQTEVSLWLCSMSYSDKDKAREHWNKSKSDADEAGQHAASAAKTVGHDLRAAADQAAQAGKYAVGRCA